ncbi:MAG: hydrogenase maturation protein HypF, partial [Candidatus Dadabacteria bacterium]|nr:hydrogenase maturation protein HypF [Candidatus Dadabacteria bacterium]
PLISSIECRIFAVFKARRLLREGYIVAIKGLGGFHLACDASNPSAVEELRRRKGRVGKPFALMAANLKVIESICAVSNEERELLTSHEKPILLLEKKALTTLQTFRVSEEIAPNVDSLGMMLPYTPLHHLLLNQTDPVLACEPVPPVLVMTSGNFSEEPIATNNVITYDVVILIDNNDLKLKPGMTAEVKILVAHKKDVLRVPTAVLRFIPPPYALVDEGSIELNNTSVAWVPLKNGRLKAVSINPGVSDEAFTEILDGNLGEGEKVIVEATENTGAGSEPLGPIVLPKPQRF